MTGPTQVLRWNSFCGVTLEIKPSTDHSCESLLKQNPAGCCTHSMARRPLMLAQQARLSPPLSHLPALTVLPNHHHTPPPPAPAPCPDCSVVLTIQHILYTSLPLNSNTYDNPISPNTDQHAFCKMLKLTPLQSYFCFCTLPRLLGSSLYNIYTLFSL